MEDDLDLTMTIPSPTIELSEDLSARIEAAIRELQAQLQEDDARGGS